MMKTTISQFLVGFMLLLPSFAIAGDVNNDGFDDGDVAVLQQIIADNPATTLTWSGTDYASWTGVRWDNSVPKRVDTLYAANKNLTTMDVSSLTRLEVLYCQNNKLTSLQIKGLSYLNDLVIVNNQLSSLDVTGVTSLQNFNGDKNMFSLSALIPLKALGLNDYFTYSNQASVFDERNVMAGYEIDFSSEATINGVATVFTWYRNDTIIPGTDQSGTYTPTEEGVFYCTMTNTEFPNVTITTNNRTVKKCQVIFDIKYKDGTDYPIQKIIIEGKEIYADSTGMVKTTLLAKDYNMNIYSVTLDDLLTWIPIKVTGQDSIIDIRLCKVTFDTKYPDGTAVDYNLAVVRDTANTKIYLRDFYGEESFVKTTALMNGNYKLLFTMKADDSYNYVTFPSTYSCTINPTDTVKVISIVLPEITPHTATLISSEAIAYSILDSTGTSIMGSSITCDVKCTLLQGTYTISGYNANRYKIVNQQFTMPDYDISVEIVLYDYSTTVDDATQTVVVYDTTGAVVDTATVATTKSSSGIKRFTISLPVGTYIYKAFDAEGNLLTESTFRVGEIGDTVIVKVTKQTTTSLDQYYNQSSTITVYPNPATNYIQVQATGKTMVNIYSVDNKLVSSQMIDPRETISVANLPAGIYLVKITSNNTNTVKKSMVR